MRFFVVLLFAFLSAGAQEAPSELFVNAGQCLANAKQDWLDLAHHNGAAVELGFATDPAVQRGEQTLYVVDYITPDHSEGMVYPFEVSGDRHHRVLRLLFTTRFRQSDDGSQRVELVDPPFGGIGTHDEIISAIRQIGFGTYKLPVAQLQARRNSVSCEMDEELP